MLEDDSFYGGRESASYNWSFKRCDQVLSVVCVFFVMQEMMDGFKLKIKGDLICLCLSRLDCVLWGNRLLIAVLGANHRFDYRCFGVNRPLARLRV